MRWPPDETKLENAGKLLLRLLVGGALLPHGLHKATHGLSGIREVLSEKGLPTFLAPGVIVGEVIAPLLLVLGIFPRPAAVVIAFNMVMAIALEHAHGILAFGSHGQWKIELPALYLFGGIACALLGPGPWALGRHISARLGRKGSTRS